MQQPITQNKYIYGNSNPVMYTDPSGRKGLAENSTLLGVQSALIRSSTQIARIGTVNFSRVAANDARSTVAVRLSEKEVGLLTLIAGMGAGGAKYLHLLEQKSKEEDEKNYNKLFHGTDIKTARLLATGAPIDVDTSNSNWNASNGGFYLANQLGDAEHFAVFTQSGPRDGGVVQYNFSKLAYLSILGVSQTGPIPRTKRYEPMGNEIVVPPSALPIFNGFMDMGKIIPGGVR